MIWRKSAATDAVLRVFAQRTIDGVEWHYGLDLMRAAKVRAGLFYSVLDDLERAGTIEAKWAVLESGRKYRRRLYRLAEERPPCPRCGQPMHKVPTPIEPGDPSWVWGHSCEP